MGRTKAVGWTAAVLASLVTDDGDRDAILRAAGVRPEAFANPENRIALELDHAVWREMVRVIPRGSGLRFAERAMSPSSVGLLGFLAMTADTVGHALDLAVRYHRLLEDAATTRSYRGDGKMVILFEPEFEGPPIPEAVETALAAYAMLLRAWSDKDARPLEVYFAHGRPPDVDEHHRVFGCPVHFDAEHNAMVLSEAVLSIPLRTANPELRSYLEALARQRLGEVPEADTLPLQIRDELERSFAEGPPDLAEVAKRLHISARTLQRRLKEHGVGFQQIVDEVRFRRAVVMLAETELPIGQIAQQLGFAEPRGFRRAFRRWSGLSPQAYRSSR